MQKETGGRMTEGYQSKRGTRIPVLQAPQDNRRRLAQTGYRREVIVV